MFTTYTQGKLLLTAEYVVLDGAQALAVPCRFGQGFEVVPTTHNIIEWNSIDDQGNTWFAAQFEATTLHILECTDVNVANRLQQILQVTQHQFTKGYKVTTQLDFPREWGLGTSSTLLAAIGQWLNINSYQLLADTFGGSGYDIACANAKAPLFYRIQNGEPLIESASFNPSFSASIYFVYLGQKQNSRDGIAHYRQRAKTLVSPSLIQEISTIGQQLCLAKDIDTFGQLIDRHEEIIAQITQLPKVKDLYFPDFKGSMKSLGAWGGDFILAVSKQSPQEVIAYFNAKGKDTILRYEEMVL